MLDTDLLRTFIAIADSGGFTRAAQVVHRSQSAVSMQMKKLEITVGNQLFEKVGQDGGYICAMSDHFFETLPQNIRVFADAARECIY